MRIVATFILSMLVACGGTSAEEAFVTDILSALPADHLWQETSEAEFLDEGRAICSAYDAGDFEGVELLVHPDTGHDEESRAPWVALYRSAAVNLCPDHEERVEGILSAVEVG